MKRTIEFQILDDKYSYKENGVEIFEVNKQERQVDVKQFYNAFFSNGKDYSEIEFEASSEMDKEDRRVFDAISKLIEDICTRLKSELITGSYNSNCYESIDSYKMPDQ
jgi:hypothetical protein